MKKITFLILFLFISTVTFSQDVLMQNGTVNTCSGTFYDSGGGAGNYGNDENFTLTICPDEPGSQIQLDFTAFNTQQNSDSITFYDGDDVTANPFGTYSGGGAGANPGFVSATPNNVTGCITIVFTSNDSANSVGWSADISCFTPCQTITSQLDSTSVAPNQDGYIWVCPDEEITLTGSGAFSADGTGATYEWDLGDGNTVPGQTATFSYSNPGVYIVNLNITDTNTDPDPGTGCTNTNLINQVIQVGTEPDFTGTEAVQDTLCFGEVTTIEGVVTPTEFINDCTPPVSGTTFLPDGNGASYSTCVTVDCYDSAQTLTNVDQIVGICVNMEHSFMGDLDINIISPSGQMAVLKGYPGGNGTYLGGANDDGTNTPGIGADYCFSTAGTVTLENGPTIIAGSNPPNTSITPGMYLPEGSFNDLLGSPLNGDWCIQIIDNLGFDNGFIFSWSIQFDPNLQPPELSFTPQTVTEGWDADPTITATTGNTITVAPPTAGQFCYTYRTTDNFGCEYTEQVCIDVLPEIITDEPNDLYLCDVGAPPYIFDLTENDTVINAPAPNPLDQIITYFETQADADNNTNAIATPDTYTSTAVIGTPQTIYVRIEYLTSGCFETETFTLNVVAPPIINPAPDMELCDDASNDGTEPFDLESQNATVLGPQSNTDYTVTYYTTFVDANAGTNALVSDYDNVANPEPIYVRVDSAGALGCFIASPTPVFNLIVNPIEDASFTMQANCNGGTVDSFATAGGTYAFNPAPTDSATIDPTTGEVTNGTSGATYTVEYSFGGACPSSTTFDLTVLSIDDASFTMIATCTGGTVDTVALPGGLFVFNPAPIDTAVIDANTGEVTNVTFDTTYTIEYTTNGACPETSQFDLVIPALDDPSFTVLATCDGAVVDTVTTPGGVFALNPVPTDGTTIDVATGEVTGGTSNTSYTIEYTTNGTCPDSSTQSFVVNTTEDASFTMLATCDGGTVDSFATAGGTYAFNPLPTDTATIDPTTGAVTNGTSGANYTVEYSFGGTCPSSATFDLTVLSVDDASITMTPTCDGGIVDTEATPGGTYVFNPVP
ncbi:PKD domain-containing protein, partial [Bizionia gelidisalsuginis]